MWDETSRNHSAYINARNLIARLVNLAKMGKQFFIAALLAICCLKFSAAGTVHDVAEIAVEVISRLGSAVLQLSPDQLSTWNASLTDQKLTCVEETVKEQFIRRAKFTTECESVLQKLFEEDGSGTLDFGSTAFESGSSQYVDDERILPRGIMSALLCNQMQACGNILLSAYKECELFKDDLGKRVKRALGGLCQRNKKGEYCVDIFIEKQHTLPTAFLNCGVEGCPMSCKQELVQGSEEFGCCLHFSGSAELVGGNDSLSKLMSKCGLQEVPECGEVDVVAEEDEAVEIDATATNSGVLSMVLSVCVVSVIFGIS